MKQIIVGLLITIAISACAVSSPSTSEPTPFVPPTLDPNVTPTEFLPTLPPTVEPALTLTPGGVITTAPTREATPTPQSNATLAPAAWQEWPVIPGVSPRTREVDQKGLELGNSRLT